jgi:hypothetical protein
MEADQVLLYEGSVPLTVGLAEGVVELKLLQLRVEDRLWVGHASSSLRAWGANLEVA